MKGAGRNVGSRAKPLRACREETAMFTEVSVLS